MVKYLQIFQTVMFVINYIIFGSTILDIKLKNIIKSINFVIDYLISLSIA